MSARQIKTVPRCSKCRRPLIMMTDSILVDMSPRQREIVRLVAEGMDDKEIGSKLGIASKTVWSHRMRMDKFLGKHDDATLTRLAIREGLIKL